MKHQGKCAVEEAPVIIDVGDGAAIPKPSDKGLVSAWRLSFAGALLVLGYLLVFHPDPYLRIFKFIPDGILITFQVTVCSTPAARTDFTPGSCAIRAASAPFMSAATPFCVTE